MDVVPQNWQRTSPVTWAQHNCLNEKQWQFITVAVGQWPKVGTATSSNGTSRPTIVQIFVHNNMLFSKRYFNPMHVLAKDVMVDNPPMTVMESTVVVGNKCVMAILKAMECEALLKIRINCWFGRDLTVEVEDDAPKTSPQVEFFFVLFNACVTWPSI